MKIFNKLASALMVLPLMAALTACDNETEYTPAEALNGAQVFFANDLPSVQNIDIEGTSFDVPINRANTEGDITVKLAVEQDSTNYFTIPESVTFADGEATANITITYDPATQEYDVLYPVTITIADSTYATPYGITSYSFVAGPVAPWEDMGNATYREDLMTTFFAVENKEYEVPIQKNSITEGLYRLVNPYGKAYPYNEDGDYDATTNVYWVIHAEDPDYVWLEPHATVMDWGYGKFGFTSLVGYLIAAGKTLDEVKATYPDNFGKLKDGVITFPTPKSLLISMADYNDGSWYYGNSNGMFAIALPGAKLISYDYTATALYAGILKTSTDEYQAVVDFTLGPDVASAKYAMTDASVTESAAAGAIVSGELEATEITEGGRQYLPLTEDGKYRVTLVTFDAEGNAQESSSCAFDFAKGGSTWQSLGKALYTDDFMTFGYYDEETEEWISASGLTEPITYEVEVEESTVTPGLYRLKNAYGEANTHNEAGEWDTSMDYYLEIDATDPANVFITKQELGNNWGAGMFSVESDASYYMNLWSATPAQVVATFASYSLPSPFGTLSEGVITFPADVFTVYYGESSMYGNHNGAFKVVLPEARTSETKGYKAAKRYARRGHIQNVNASNKTRLNKMLKKYLTVNKTSKMK